MNDQELSVLFKKLLENKCSEEEAELLLTLLADKSNEKQLYWLIKNQLQDPGFPNAADDISDSVKESLDLRLQQILNSDIPVSKKPAMRIISPGRLWYAAAVVILFISIGSYFYIKDSIGYVSEMHQPGQEIVAGRNKAILTLSNGQKINLDDVSAGNIATQANTIIEKSKNGVLTYNEHSEEAASNQRPGLIFNTVTIPKGGQYQIILPDGSRVWLNAASSLKFPAQFSKDERVVELQGEGYFEIVSIPRPSSEPGNGKKGNLPFIVRSNHQKIEVVGTEFNVNAYPDETSVKTTLVQGSVKVCVLNGLTDKELTSNQTLRPGQQSVITGNDLVIQNGNIESATAWKNGSFQFDNEEIQVVMRKIARWYDVEIEYHGSMHGKVFSGTISKYKDVKDVLRMLQLTGSVSFVIKDRRILVS